MATARIQLRRDTASNWTSTNPVLASGELGLETDTGKIKVGNNSSAWTALDYTVYPLAFSDLTTTPTTISGYGITDAFDGAFSSLTGTPTTLSGYGITDAAPLASPTFTGTPAAPTATSGANTTQIATTAFVQQEVTAAGSYNDASVDTHLNTSTATTNEVLSWNGTDYNWVAQSSSGIALTDLSVTTTAAGTAALNYNNTTGVFSYTPPNLSSYLTAETNDLTSAVTWANVPDANITESSVTQHQAALSITESQISDLQSYLTSVALNDVSDVTITSLSSGQILKYNGTAWVNAADSGGIALTDLSVTTNTAGTAALSYNNSTGVFSYTPPDLSSYLTSYTVTESDVTAHQAALSITESQISDLQSYLTAETNDLTSAVTWANVPDANITQSSVTQHQAALSITESQISDLQTYLTGITGQSIENLSDVTTMTPTDGQVLTWDNTNSYWYAASPSGGSYNNSSVDSHLNTSTAATNEVLSWNGSDYDWVAQSGGGGGIALTDLSVTTNTAGTAALSYNNSTGVFSYTPPDLSSYLTAETNDLTSAVTWANVPNANITESSVTQHQAALSITSTQVSDFGEAVDDQVNTLLQAGLGVDFTYDDANNELTIDSNHVEVNCTNNSGASISIGTPVYQTGVSGNNITIAPADADDSNKMPAIGLTTSTIANGNEGTVVILGVVTGLDTSTFTAGDTVYIGTTPGSLTTTPPTGESGLIQNFGRVLKVNASSGSIAVMGAGRANAVANLNDGNVFIGNSSNQAEARALVEADISDLQTYLTSYTETDTLDSVTGRGNSTTNSITVGNATVTGNLTVQGTTTTLETATLNVEDKNITINYSTGDSSGSADGAGITIQDAVNSTTDATLLWDATGDKFEFSHAVDVAGNITVSGTVDGRDVATDGTKLDGIEASADVTDATNVAAAGAVMDSDFTANGFMKRTGDGTYTIDTNTYLTSISVGGLSDITVSNVADNEVLAYDSSSSSWINQTAAEAGLATSSQGTLADSALQPADLSVTTNSAGTAALSYSNGVFTYTPPDLSSYLTAETNDLTSAVTWANVPNANITESSVTQHQAALSITESQISDLGTYLTGITGENIGSLSDVTISSVAAGEVLRYSGSAWVNSDPIAGRFSIVNSSSSAYVFTGSGTSSDSNPTLYLTRGQTYEFVVNASGHPFYIKTVSGTGTGNAYSDGVTNNGAETGTVTLAVQMDAPDTLYYNCSAHSAMAGTIYILDSTVDLSDFSVTTNSAGTAALSYSNGVFTYTPPDLSSYLTAETNDLTSAVTWANVPNANITEGSVTQHQAALSITESQISDLQTYLTGITGQSIENLSDVTTMTPTDGQVLTWDNTNSYWYAASPSGGSYNDSSVDSHLNTSTAATNEVLSWNGSDYDWVAQSGGSGIALTDLSVTTNSAGTAALSYNNTTGVFSYTPPDLSSYLTGITTQSIENLSDVNTMTPTDGQVLTWDNANSRWDAATPSGGGSYSDSSVDTHLNTSTASANEVLSWNGSDYDWVAQSGGGGGGSSVTVSETAPSSPSSGDLWFDPNALKTYIYYNDGDSNQWVQANPSGGGSGALVVSKNIALNFFFGS